MYFTVAFDVKRRVDIQQAVITFPDEDCKFIL